MKNYILKISLIISLLINLLFLYFFINNNSDFNRIESLAFIPNNGICDYVNYDEDLATNSIINYFNNSSLSQEKSLVKEIIVSSLNKCKKDLSEKNLSKIMESIKEDLNNNNSFTFIQSSLIFLKNADITYKEAIKAINNEDIKIDFYIGFLLELGDIEKAKIIFNKAIEGNYDLSLKNRLEEIFKNKLNNN